jgi:type I restriction enzyme S subunit
LADNLLAHTTFAQLISDGVLEIGDGYRAKNSELGGEGLIFLRAGHVTDTDIDFGGVEHFHEALSERLNNKIAKPGDVVVTTKGNSTGRAAFVTESMPPFVYSPHLSYWRSRDRTRLAPGFLRYWSKSSEFLAQLTAMKGSTDMAPYLSLTDQRRLRISLPQLDLQRQIGHVLGALDDKIELNRRMNETLEAMARALFKSWFIDFDPVRAHAEHLSHDVLQLFPKALARSDGRELPLGWRWEPLLSRARLISGGTPKTNVAEYWGGSIPWASAKDVSQCDTVLLAETERSITERGLEESSTKIIPKFSTLVVARGATTGRFCMAGIDMAMNQTCYALETTEETPFWLNCAFANVVDSLVQAAHGSVFDTITTKTIEGAMTVAAPLSVIESFEKAVTPWFLRILEGLKESRTLATLRDTLLPKLISGEIRVKDAEKLVEAIA